MYEKQAWQNGPAGNTPIDKDALDHIEDGIFQASSQKLYVPREQMFGPAHAETPTITTGIAGDGTYNELYVIAGNVPPANWPFDIWGDLLYGGNTQGVATAQPISSVGTWRVMADGADIVFLAPGGYEVDFFIDGQPYASNPILTANSAGLGLYGYTKILFSTNRPRLLEFRTLSGFSAVYTRKPYRLYKPPADPNPKVAVVGDSWVYPVTLSNTLAAQRTPDPWITGLYQRIGQLLGITAVATDGIGGTGYINGGGPGKNYGHVDRLAWLNRIQPDVIVVHGGGANDLFGGNTVNATVAAAVDYFEAVRAQHPRAKIVFVEGFAPPGFTPGTCNPNYILIRQGVQAALEAVGIKLYYIDVATTRPPINGSGYVTAPNTTGNSDVYIGYDQVHYSANGAWYLRHFMANKLRLVLADVTRELEGSLI